MYDSHIYLVQVFITIINRPRSQVLENLLFIGWKHFPSISIKFVTNRCWKIFHLGNIFSFFTYSSFGSGDFIFGVKISNFLPSFKVSCLNIAWECCVLFKRQTQNRNKENTFIPARWRWSEIILLRCRNLYSFRF